MSSNIYDTMVFLCRINVELTLKYNLLTTIKMPSTDYDKSLAILTSITQSSLSKMTHLVILVGCVSLYNFPSFFSLANMCIYYM